MAVVAQPEKVRVYEAQTVLVRARVTSSEGVAYSHDGSGGAAQPKITQVTVKVFDMSGATPTTAVVTKTWTEGGSPATSAVLLAQGASYLTAGWTKDATGYNMMFDLQPADVLWEGGHLYRVEVLCNTTVSTSTLAFSEGRVAFQVYVECIPGYSS